MGYRVFRTPGEGVVHGQGALDHLTQLKGRKAVIVTDEGVMRKLGLVDKVAGLLAKAGIQAAVVEGVEPDPSITTVDRVTAFVKAEKPDLVVGLGGGSSIDAGKVAWGLYENPDLDFDGMFKQKVIGNLRRKARYVAIPSTSGTGSEVTPYAIVTDRRKSPNIKCAFAQTGFIPDFAILDPEVARSMPPRVTANTGMDALSHLLECYVCNKSTDFTDAVSLRGLQLIFKYLPRAYADGNDMEARDRVQTAACMGGMAIAEGAGGIVHSFGHVLGAEFGLPHGAGMSLFMRYCIQYNAKDIPEKYADMAEALGVAGKTTEAGVSGLLDAIDKLQDTLNMPKTVPAAGIPMDKFMKNLDVYSQIALVDGATPTNWRVPTLEDMRNIFLCAVDGRDVTF